MPSLTEKQQMIVTEYLGLKDGNAKTLREIGDNTPHSIGTSYKGVTCTSQERIRQILHHSLRRLDVNFRVRSKRRLLALRWRKNLKLLKFDKACPCCSLPLGAHK